MGGLAIGTGLTLVEVAVRQRPGAGGPPVDPTDLLDRFGVQIYDRFVEKIKTRVPGP